MINMPNKESIETWERKRFDIEDQRRFWNSWNREYREQNKKLGLVNRRQAQMVIDWLMRIGRKDLNVLEVGCGSGWLCQQLVPFGQVTGTDLSDDVLDRTKAISKEIRFISGDFFQLDFPIASFDVVVSLEVLAHVADQTAFVAKIARLLRPGGHLMLATQNRFALKRWSGVVPQGVGQIRKWVDVKTLRRLLTSEFDVIELTSIVPVGDRGILRVINSLKVNKLISVFASRSRIEGLKERFFLGHTLMVLARRSAR